MYFIYAWAIFERGIQKKMEHNIWNELRTDLCKNTQTHAEIRTRRICSIRPIKQFSFDVVVVVVGTLLELINQLSAPSIAQTHLNFTIDDKITINVLQGFFLKKNS